MTTQTKLGIAGAAVFLLAGIFGVSTWLSEHDARLKAEAAAQANQTIIDHDADALKQHQADDKEREAQIAATVATLAATAAKQVTPEQIAAWLPKQVQMPQPITVTIPVPTIDNPRPNAVATIPQEDLPALRDYVSKCQIGAAQLTSCQADVASRDAQLKIKTDQIAEVTKQRDDYKTALNGGTFWQRTKKAAKYLTVGGGIAIVAICGSGHCK